MFIGPIDEFKLSNPKGTNDTSSKEFTVRMHRLEDCSAVLHLDDIRLGRKRLKIQLIPNEVSGTQQTTDSLTIEGEIINEETKSQSPPKEEATNKTKRAPSPDHDRMTRSSSRDRHRRRSRSRDRPSHHRHHRSRSRERHRGHRHRSRSRSPRRSRSRSPRRPRL